MEDNFFEIGGHSLKAIQVIVRIQDEFNIIMPVRRIFEFPRLAELARQIDFDLFYQKQNLDSVEKTSGQEKFVI